MRQPLYFLLLLSLWGCESDRNFPPFQDVDELPQTQFSGTLEQAVDWRQNQLYCVTLEYAWQAVKTEVGDELTVQESDEELWFLNAAPPAKNTLTEEEMDVSVRVQFQQISAVSRFEKNLPFEAPFFRNKRKMDFGGQAVQSFGTTGTTSDLHQQLDVLYYENDAEFAVRLRPADAEHEILLFTSQNPVGKSLSERLTSCGEKMVDHLLQQKDTDNAWRYDFLEEDTLSIPVFGFNLQHDYDSLIGKKLYSSTEHFGVLAVSQRIALVLDEQGAKIESDAKVELVTEEIPELPEPKSLVFDKPFLLVFQRKDATRPYLVAWICNDELLVKR